MVTYAPKKSSEATPELSFPEALQNWTRTSRENPVLPRTYWVPLLCYVLSLTLQPRPSQTSMATKIIPIFLMGKRELGEVG